MSLETIPFILSKECFFTSPLKMETLNFLKVSGVQLVQSSGVLLFRESA